MSHLQRAIPTEEFLSNMVKSFNAVGDGAIHHKGMPSNEFVPTECIGLKGRDQTLHENLKQVSRNNLIRESTDAVKAAARAAKK